ncbi:MAG: OmpH family outer membrane protein [Melioribacteraceae bacterium]|nr:OmpH family outer membrane protein [Melioribacteraceae bacterium]
MILLTTISVFGQTQKTGYVDSQVILAQYPAAIKAQGDLDALIKEWQTTLETMRGEVQKLYADYQKQAESMTPEAQQTAQQTVVAKEREVQTYYQQKFAQPGGEVVSKQEELLAPVKAKIMEAIEAVAKEEKMTFMFDKSGDILLLYADSAFDMTYKVLDKLKRGK